MVAFPAMVADAEARSQVAASWQQVGADAIVAAPSGAVISADLQRQVASVPGVVATAAAVVEGGSLPNGNELSVVFVDPASYAAVADRTPGPPFPLAALSGPAAPGTAGGGQAAVVPAVATADAAQLFAAASSSAGRPGPVDLTVGAGASAIAVRLAGQVGGVPGVAPPAVVVPLRALGPSPPGPDLMLVAGPHLDVARLSAVVGRALPGGSVTSRATTRPCRRKFAVRSRSGTARRAARRYGTRPPTSRARPRCTCASTRRWTGRAGFSSRAR